MSTCNACKEDTLGFKLEMAFQPIIDIETQSVLAYESLVRGLNQESAFEMLSKVNDSNRYAFDQACRVRAIELAAQLGLEDCLSINFLPNAVYKPENCIRTTLKTAKENNFAYQKIIFEVTETEHIHDPQHLKHILKSYKEMGFRTAIDDFGAGYAGLSLLAEFQPDFVKIDMMLLRGIENAAPKQAIVRGLTQICRELNIDVIAEGVETEAEFDWLLGLNLRYFQGYLFSKPGFKVLPKPYYPQP